MDLSYPKNMFLVLKGLSRPQLLCRKECTVYFKIVCRTLFGFCIYMTLPKVGDLYNGGLSDTSMGFFCRSQLHFVSEHMKKRLRISCKFQFEKNKK